MLYAWKLGPDRAERLVIASLLNEAVIKRIRDRWDFPRSSEVTRVSHDAEAATQRAVDEMRTLTSDLRRELGELSRPTSVNLPPDAVESLTASLRMSLKAQLPAIVGEVMERAAKDAMPTALGEGEILEMAEAEMDLRVMGDALIEQYGVDERLVRGFEKYGPKIGKALVQRYFPDLYEAFTEGR